MARSTIKARLHKVNAKNLVSIKQQLAKEADYLNIMQNALNLHDYLTIYKLLNPSKYNAVVGSAHATSLVAQPNLIVGFKDSLSHYLGKNLISYLTQTFPFLYFDEYKLGRFHVFFGDWWDHKLFGSLDVINVNFQFNIKEYNKLRNKFLGATASGLSNGSTTAPQSAEQKRIAAQQQMARQNARRAHQKARANANRQNSLQNFSQAQQQRDSLKLKLENRLKENDAKTGFFNNRRRKARHDVLVKALQKLTKKDEQAFRQEMIIKNGGTPKSNTGVSNTQSAPAPHAPKLSTQLQAKASQNSTTSQSAQTEQSTPVSNNSTNTIRKTTNVQSPEQTILQYECNSIRKYFGNMTQFAEKGRQIYHDYIMYLLQQAQDKATISATNVAIAKTNTTAQKPKTTHRTTHKKTTRKRTTHRRKRRTTHRKTSRKRTSHKRKSTRRKTSTRRRRK